MTIPFPAIDPVAVSIGPFPLRWYALAYIFGIAFGWLYAVSLLKKPALWPDGKTPVTKPQLDDAVFGWIALGVFVGGRLGYVLFYEPSLLVEPWPKLGDDLPEGFFKQALGWLRLPPALMTWKGGMSFHGGFIGVALAVIYCARKYKTNVWSFADLFACAAPIGLFFGRIANFINAELYGRPWSGPWSMVFPTDPMQLPRHPSQLYEAALEGIVLFAMLFVAARWFGVLKKPGAAVGLFLVGYGLARIIVENFRMPDAHMPDFPLGLTMGMILSLPMLAGGLWLLLRGPGSLVAQK
jgi:phosphatidylglycerol:prolipoprotein diacylglycerol transferase